MSRKDVGKPLEDVYLLKLSKKFNGTFKIKILGETNGVGYTVFFPHYVSLYFRCIPAGFFFLSKFHQHGIE